MSTNYTMLLRSEKILKNMIVEYIELIQEVHQKLWIDIFENSKKATNLHFIVDNCEKRIERTENMEENLIDECIWTISKDDPRANHLRFIVSIIYSTKDLTRSLEYAKSIAKVIVRKQLTNYDELVCIKPLINNYLSLFTKFIKIYQSSKNEKSEESERYCLEYEEIEGQIEKELSILTAKEKNKNYENFINPVFQIIKLINSTVERIKSIFPTTIFEINKTSSFTIKSKLNKK